MLTPVSVAFRPASFLTKSDPQMAQSDPQRSGLGGINRQDPQLPAAGVAAFAAACSGNGGTFSDEYDVNHAITG